MSFWSSLTFCRVAAPPIVTPAAIAHFIRGLASTGAIPRDNDVRCEIKYGPRVDADERTTNMIQWDESCNIGVVGHYPWDRFEGYSSINAMADALMDDRQPIYRAYLSLGTLHDDIVTALTREPSEENEIALCLSDLSFGVGPVIISGLGSETPAFAGWMGLTLSGPGYYYPWEYREVRERAESIGLVQRLADACRRAWPVVPVVPSAAAVDGRRRLGDLWLYDDVSLPHDWLWFVSES